MPQVTGLLNAPEAACWSLSLSLHYLSLSVLEALLIPEDPFATHQADFGFLEVASNAQC